MSKLQFYKLTTWLLLFINIVAIGFFFLTKPRHPHRPPPSQSKQWAIDLLQLDEQQQKLLLESAYAHSQNVISISKQQKDLLKPYFYQLGDTSDSIDNELILNELETLERRKAEVTYQHLQEVKSFLREDQTANYSTFIELLLKKVLVESEKNPPPPKDF